MKIHKYNIKKYNFGELLYDKSTLDSGYKIIRSKKFIEIWKSFVTNELTKILNSNKIVMQKLPSLRIHPGNTNSSYTTESNDNGVWANIHKDSEAPYHHPEFDINFWLPLTDVNLENTLYVESELNHYEPVLLKYGEFLEFKGNSINHGGKVYNESECLRMSLDFRGCAHNDYDESVLIDIPIFVTNQINKTQKSWFVIGEYYSLFEGSE